MSTLYLFELIEQCQTNVIGYEDRGRNVDGSCGCISYGPGNAAEYAFLPMYPLATPLAPDGGQPIDFPKWRREFHYASDWQFTEQVDEETANAPDADYQWRILF